MKFLLEAAGDGELLIETIDAASQADAEVSAVDVLRKAWMEDGDELSDFGHFVGVRPYIADDYARDAAGELLAMCRDMLPAGVCLTNKNVPDAFAVPIDVSMGDLRRLAAVIAKATGE